MMPGDLLQDQFMHLKNNVGLDVILISRNVCTEIEEWLGVPACSFDVPFTAQTALYQRSYHMCSK